MLLYALEDFSFADFIHLAVYHQRDMFAASPVGKSLRSWNPDSSLNPVLSMPHQRLSDHGFPSKNHRASRKFRHGASLALDKGTDGGKHVEHAAEAEALKVVEVPEMQKWAKLLENGGVRLVTKSLSQHESCLTLCQLQWILHNKDS